MHSKVFVFLLAHVGLHFSIRETQGLQNTVHSPLAFALHAGTYIDVSIGQRGQHSLATFEIKILC